MANTIVFDNTSAMKAYGFLNNNDLYQTKGYYDPGDGGSGLYRWVSGDTTTPPNEGAVLGIWDSETVPAGYANGRFHLVHSGVVNVRQFGAHGDGDDETLTERFADEDQIAATYPTGVVGGPFSGLDSGETSTWAAVQAALQWCGETGVRCEVPSGVYLVSRPVWLGDDTTFADGGSNEESGRKDTAVMGLTFVGQTGNSRQEADGGVANLKLVQDCANRFALSWNEDSVEDEIKLHVRIGDVDDYVGPYSLTSTASDVIGDLDALLDPDYDVAEAGTDPGALLSEETVFFTVRPAVAARHRRSSDRSWPSTLPTRPCLRTGRTASPIAGCCRSVGPPASTSGSRA